MWSKIMFQAPSLWCKLQGTKAACSPCKHLYGKQNHVTNITSLMPSTKYAHIAWGARSCYSYHLFDARHKICTSQSHCMRSKIMLQPILLSMQGASSHCINDCVINTTPLNKLIHSISIIYDYMGLMRHKSCMLALHELIKCKTNN